MSLFNYIDKTILLKMDEADGNINKAWSHFRCVMTTTFRNIRRSVMEEKRERWLMETSDARRIRSEISHRKRSAAKKLCTL